MTKKKSLTPHHSEPHELQFFAVLPLEDAVARLYQLVPNYTVDVTALDDDAYRFAIYRGTLTAPNTVYVKGIIRRWEGTFTRLDCEAGYQREKSTLKIKPHYLLWICWSFLIVGTLLILLRRWQIPPGMQILLVGVAAVGIVYYLGQRTVPDAHWVAYLEERRALLDALKQQFASTGGLAYSPEDLTENMALALEAEQRLSQGSTS
jgi:hypothetical protein